MPKVSSIKAKRQRENNLELFTRLIKESEEVAEYINVIKRANKYLKSKEQVFICVDELEQYLKERRLELIIMLTQMKGDL